MMKHILQGLGLCLVGALSLVSCDGIDYEGNYNQGFAAEKQSRMVYFEYVDGVDSISYSFSFEPHSKREHTIPVPVRIAGTMPTSPLKYRVVLDDKRSYVTTPRADGSGRDTVAVAANYYQALQPVYTIEAGQVQTALPITVSRDAISNGQIVRLVLRLEASEDLGVGFAAAREISLVVSNEIPQGYKDFWTNYLYPYYGAGPYSDMKFLKLLEYYDSDIDKLNADVYKPTFFLNLGKLYKYFHEEHPELGQDNFNYEQLKNVLPYI